MKRRMTPKKKSSPAKRRGKRAVKVSRARPTAVRARQQRDFIDGLIAASAQALGLTIDPAWCDGIRLHLRLVLDHAARVEEFSLPDEAEPAPVFHA